MTYIKKIFFENKPMIFTDDLIGWEPIIQKGDERGLKRLDGANAETLTAAENIIEDENCLGIIIKENEKKLVKKLLQESFKKVVAAGGVVTGPSGRILMIFRNGKWDLPKGKQEAGETVAECALREVMEETGLGGKISLGKKICKTHHTYLYKSKGILKVTHWYRMEVAKEKSLIPQEEEGISFSGWMTGGAASLTMENSWETIREVLTRGKYLK